MAQLTDFEKLRRRRARKKFLRNLLLLAVFAAVVGGIYFFSQQLKEVDLKTAVSEIKADITTGNGYPVALPEGKLATAFPLDSALILAGDTHIYSYNDTGRQILNMQHGLSNPKIASSRDRFIAYDCGGTKLSVFSRSALIHTMTLPYTIYCADLAANGNFAVATGSGEFLSQVEVYDGKFNQILTCYSAEKPVIAVSLADNRDMMVVGTLDVENGVYRSAIERFVFSAEKVLAHVDLPDELLLNLDYHDGSFVRALTDKRVVLYDQNLRERKDFSFGGNRLLRFETSRSGKMLLILESLAGEKQNTLVLLDTDLSEEGRFLVDSGLTDINFDEKYIYLDVKDTLLVMTPKGELSAQLAVPNLHFLQPSGNTLYYAADTQLTVVQIQELVAPPKNGKKQPGKKNSKNSSEADTSKASSDETEEAVSKAEGADSESGSSEASKNETNSSLSGEEIENSTSETESAPTEARSEDAQEKEASTSAASAKETELQAAEDENNPSKYDGIIVMGHLPEESGASSSDDASE